MRQGLALRRLEKLSEFEPLWKVQPLYVFPNNELMPFSTKRLFTIAILGTILASASWLFLPDFFYSQNFESQKAPESRIHAFRDQSRDLSAIRIKIVYAIPFNQSGTINNDWQRLIKKSFDDVAEFHNIQFRGKSKINYDIYSEPLILERNDSYYSSESTAHGNLNALFSVSEEVERRLFKKSGDLHDEAFAGFSESEYPVLGVIYEGVGAVGGGIYYSEFEKKEDIAKSLGRDAEEIHIVDLESVDGFFLVSSAYLFKKDYVKTGPSVIYHEIGHTFGIPDQYDHLTNMPYSADIMGAGRNQAFDITYIDRSTTREMGLTE